jgi:hypothetical protein
MEKTELLEAFEAKLVDCRRRAKECYECQGEDCTEIGKYWDAATIEIQRFKQELLFLQNNQEQPPAE